MQASPNLLTQRLIANSPTFHSVVDFDHKKEKIIHLEFTDKNEELSEIDFKDTISFGEYVSEKLKNANYDEMGKQAGVFEFLFFVVSPKTIPYIIVLQR